MDRLIHIISLSPTLAPQAFKRALQLLTASTQRDTEYYKVILSAYDAVATRQGIRIPPLEELLPDHTPFLTWIEQTNERNNAERRKLEVELKTYTGNVLKESIRMAYRDLAAFYRASGSFESSLRHLTKSREYCSTAQDMLEMCLSVLEVFAPLLLFSCYRNLLTTHRHSSFWNNAAFHTCRRTSSRPSPLWMALAHRCIRLQLWASGQAGRDRKRSICIRRSRRSLSFVLRFRTWRTGITPKRRTISSSRCPRRSSRPGQVQSSRWGILPCMRRCALSQL